MPSRDKVIAAGRRKREFREGAKKTSKITAWLIAFVLLFCVAIVGVIVGTHFITINKEIEMLSSNGLYNQVKIDEDRNLNVAVYGSNESGHVIVPIASCGVQDFTVFAKHMIEPMKDGLCVALIDRAGYGHSDDSELPQTIEQIVSDYRTGLQKAGVEAPYILMAHEFGSVYATYWAAQYPDEIEGIIHINGTPIGEQFECPESPIGELKWYDSIIYKYGWQRVDQTICGSFPQSLLTEEVNQARALRMNSIYTKAQLSEAELMKENYNKAVSVLEKNNIPKVYVSAIYSFSTTRDVKLYFEHKNLVNEAAGEAPFYAHMNDQTQFKKDALVLIEESTKGFSEITKPFADSLGNCAITHLPGDPKIYEQELDAFSNLIVDVIRYVEGNSEAIMVKYEDSKLSAWEQYKIEHKAEIEQQSPTNPVATTPPEQ